MRVLVLLVAVVCLLPAASAFTSYNATFDNGIEGWSGSCTQNATTGTLYVTTNFATCTSPVLNLSSLSWFRYQYRGYHTLNGTSWKGYAVEESTTAANDHVLMDNVAGEQRWRNEPAYDQTCGNITYAAWHTYTWTYNRTNTTHAGVTFNLTQANGTSCQWQKVLAINWTTGHNHVRLAPGDVNGGFFAADNMTLTVLDNETPANYTPVMSDVHITPTGIQDNQDATGWMNATDPSGLNLTYFCDWRVEGTIIASPVLAQRVSGIEQQTATIAETNYGVGDRLNLTCVASNGVHNSSTMSAQFTVQGTGGGTTVVVQGGGAPSPTVIIQQINQTAALAFGSDLLTRFNILHDYQEQPRLVKAQIRLNKAVKSCPVTGNITCTISANGTVLEVAHRISDYGFLTRTIPGTVTAVSTHDETTSTRIEFKLFNAAAGIGPTLAWHPPSLFEDVPYLVRVDHQGRFAGIRLLPLTLFLVIIGILMYRSWKKGR